MKEVFEMKISPGQERFTRMRSSTLSAGYGQ
jgi:hypothetical protein